MTQEPKEEFVAELLAMMRIIRTLMETLASGPGVALSVYYSLYMETLVGIAQKDEATFQAIKQHLQKDRIRYGQLLQAHNAAELLELAKFTADTTRGEDGKPIEDGPPN